MNMELFKLKRQLWIILTFTFLSLFAPSLIETDPRCSECTHNLSMFKVKAAFLCIGEVLMDTVELQIERWQRFNKRCL